MTELQTYAGRIGPTPLDLSNIPTARTRRRKGAVTAVAASRAAVYVRVSTDAQADDGGSIESQKARCRDLCAARGYDVTRTYVDSASGGNLDRPALSALRADVGRGTVGVVVVYALDRLSRSQRDTMILLDEFAACGAGLTAASQSFDTTTPTGRAMLGMLAVFAELQRAEIRERTRVALSKKADRGEATGRVPFGLTRDGVGFCADPAEWPIVERILGERVAGSTTQAIADRLNADGVPTATASRSEARGLVTSPGKWHAATVAKLCRNPHILRVATGSVSAGQPRDLCSAP